MKRSTQVIGIFLLGFAAGCGAAPDDGTTTPQDEARESGERGAANENASESPTVQAPVVVRSVTPCMPNDPGSTGCTPPPTGGGGGRLKQ